MRIAYFTDTYYPEINGVANTLSKLHQYLDNNNIEHLFFAPEYFGEEPEEYILRYRGMKVYFSPNSRLALLRHSIIKKKIQEYQPDIIHIVTEFTIGNAGLRIAKELGIPIVMSYHTNIEQYLKYFHAKILEKPVRAYFRGFHSKACLNLCPSGQTFYQLESQGYKNLDIWSRGVDTGLYNPNKRKGRWRRKFGEEKFICLYVGRLSFEKGLDVYLDAIKKINILYADKVEFVFAGDGPYRDTLEKCGLANIKLTGFVRGEELAELYADSDLFVFPSGTETFGNVLLEAMASGLPSVCADEGGITDFAVNGENAVMTDCRNSDGLCGAVIDAIANPDLRSRLSKGALKTASERSWNTVMEGLVNSYKAFIADNAKEDAFIMTESDRKCLG